jgi:hypothetical protein
MPSLRSAAAARSRPCYPSALCASTLVALVALAVPLSAASTSDSGGALWFLDADGHVALDRVVAAIERGEGQPVAWHPGGVQVVWPVCGTCADPTDAVPLPQGVPAGCKLTLLADGYFQRPPLAETCSDGHILPGGFHATTLACGSTCTALSFPFDHVDAYVLLACAGEGPNAISLMPGIAESRTVRCAAFAEGPPPSEWTRWAGTLSHRGFGGMAAMNV